MEYNRDYVAMLNRWLMADDFRAGGVRVLSPSYSASLSFKAVTINDDDESALDPNDSRVDSKFEWISNTWNSYLWKHTSEKNYEYQERCARAAHIPLFSPFIGIFVSGILRIPPTRKNATSSLWQSYYQDVDLNGTNIDVFSREALGMMLTFGRVHALTDMTSTTTSISTRYEKMMSGVRAYTYLVSPLDLVDWVTDSRGRFVWVKIREVKEETRQPGQKQENLEYVYRYWTKDEWVLVQEDDEGKEDVIASGSHHVGEVPLATMYASGSRKMLCETPFSSVLDVDRRVFNKYSELDTLERFCGFPLLAIPAQNVVGPNVLDLGPGRAFTFDADAGAPLYLSPPSEHVSGLWTRIVSQLQELRLAAGIRSSSDDSREKRSAAAINIESEVKRNQMSEWASAAQEFEHAIHRHVAKWENASEIPDIEYLKNFDYRAIAVEVDDLIKLASLDLVKNAQDVLAELAKPLVAKILKDNGVKQETIETVQASLDKSAKTVKPEINGDLKGGYPGDPPGIKNAKV